MVDSLTKQKEETEFDTISKFEYFDKIENKGNKVSAFLTIQEGMLYLRLHRVGILKKNFLTLSLLFITSNILAEFAKEDWFREWK